MSESDLQAFDAAGESTPGGAHRLQAVDGRAGSPRPSSTDRVRLSVDLPAGDAATLVDVARETGFNKTSTLVRAIRLLADLQRTVRDGGEVILTHADGTRERLLLR